MARQNLPRARAFRKGSKAIHQKYMPSRMYVRSLERKDRWELERMHVITAGHDTTSLAIYHIVFEVVDPFKAVTINNQFCPASHHRTKWHHGSIPMEYCS